MADAARFPAGHRFEGPDGQAYELTCDAHTGQLVRASMFKAINGAPEPANGKEMPKWLADQVWPERKH